MRKARRILPALAALAVVVGLAVIGVMVTAGENDESDARGETGDPAETLALAADRLVDEGSFAFEGTTRVEGRTAMSTGRADVARLYTETTERSNGLSHETLIDVDGGLAWWRVSAFPDRLGERPWVRGDALDRQVPAPLQHVRNWLEDATDARAGGEGEDGRAVVVASLPAPLLDDVYGFTGEGDEPRFVDGELAVTVDGTGRPVRIEVEATATGFAVEFDYRLDDFGVPVDVALPSGAEVDATPSFREEDIAELDGPDPVGLSQVPAGWMLMAAHVIPDDDPACTAVVLQYAPAVPGGDYLKLAVTPSGCVSDPPEGRPFSAGSYAGLVSEQAGAAGGVLRLGEAAVLFDSAGLSAGDLSLVLASLGPLDVAARPAPIRGLPSTPT